MSREDSKICEVQARDEERMRSVNEAKAYREEVTVEKRNALAQAEKDAKRAHM